MTTPRDPDRMIRAFLAEGAEELADPVFDAVRAEIETKPQRVVIGPWRMPAVNKYVPIGLGAVAVVAVLVVGVQVLRPPGMSTLSGAAAATPSPAPAASLEPTPPPSLPGTGDGPGGSVTFQMDGAPATTEVDVVVDGESVSGTAVTTFRAGTHDLRLECAARDGEFWALGGTIEGSTAEPASAGDWSAVIVKEGSPQRIGIWLSDKKSAGADCAAWLGALGFSTIDEENFHPLESGALVPPPSLPGTGDGPGGSVTFQMDGAPATTEVDVVVDGESVSGTAVTTFRAGTHDLRLECAARDGEFWALGGTIEGSTAEPASAGDWSAVIVKEGSPQRIGIWLSDKKSAGADCAAWLGALGFSTIDEENFHPLESGALVPPPQAGS